MPSRLTDRQSLQLREEQLRGILDAASEAIITINETQTIVMANATAAEVFGRSVETLVGLPLAELIPERFRAAHGHAVAAFGTSGPAVRRMSAGSRLVGLRANGEEFPIEAGISKAHADGLRLYSVILRDLSEPRRTASALRSREQLLAATFGTGNVGMAQIDPRTRRFVAANAAFQRLSGYDEAGIEGLPTDCLDHPDDPPSIDSIETLAAGGGERDTERRMVRKDGTLVWIRASVGVAVDDAGAPDRLVYVVQDITSRREMLAALQAREARLEFLVRLNDRLRELVEPGEIGYAAACLLGEFCGADRVGYAEDAGDGVSVEVTRNYTRGVPGIEGRYRYLDYGKALLEALRAGRTVVQPDIANDPAMDEAAKAAHAALQLAATVNVPLLRRGRLHAILFVHSRVPRRWTEAEVALMEDVAARLRADIERARAEAGVRETKAMLEASQAELRQLIAAQDSVQEEERLRMARELHDEVQQSLATILMEAELVRAEAHGIDGHIREALDRIERLGTEVITSMRRIVHDLRPQALEELGLVAALQTLVDAFARRAGVACRLDTSALAADDHERLAPVATCAYRLVQEALNNVGRHAAARHAIVRLASLPDRRLAVTVSDDGTGIRPGEARKPESFGLLGMRERVRAVGGSLRVQPGPAGGTVVEATLPLAIAGRRLPA